MNLEILAGKWKQFKGESRRLLGILFDDHRTEAAGAVDEIVGRRQELDGLLSEVEPAGDELLERLADDDVRRSGDLSDRGEAGTRPS